MPGPSPVTRSSGGMRSNFGFENIDSDRMQQQSVQGAVQQKALQQQSSNSPAKASGQNQNQRVSQQAKPREVGSIKQELVERPLSDIKDELSKFTNLNLLLDIKTDYNDPEQVAKRKQLHARYEQLTQVEQKVAREKYQKEIQAKQEEEKRKQLEKEKAAKSKQEAIAPPSSVSKTPGLFGAGKGQKGKSMNRLQQQMKTMGTLTGAN